MAREFNRQDHLIIVQNKLQCLECKKIIWSEDRHDYRTCGCPNQAMVDGGKDYLRRGAVDLAKIKDLSEYSMPDCLCGHTWEDHHHGCVMNMAYEDYPLNFRGCIAQECEATQTNGSWHTDKIEDRCYCQGYDCSNMEIAKAAKKFQNDEQIRNDLQEIDNGNDKCEVNKEATGSASEDVGETALAERARERYEGSTPEDYKDIKDCWLGESQGD